MTDVFSHFIQTFEQSNFIGRRWKSLFLADWLWYFSITRHLANDVIHTEQLHLVQSAVHRMLRNKYSICMSLSSPPPESNPSHNSKNGGRFPFQQNDYSNPFLFHYYFRLQFVQLFRLLILTLRLITSDPALSSAKMEPVYLRRKNLPARSHRK